jgi:hypothetical protein
MSVYEVSATRQRSRKQQNDEKRLRIDHAARANLVVDHNTSSCPEARVAYERQLEGQYQSKSIRIDTDLLTTFLPAWG